MTIPPPAIRLRRGGGRQARNRVGRPLRWPSAPCGRTASTRTEAGHGTWTDFLTVETWTTRGIVDVLVLFFLQTGSRKAFVTGVTAGPSPDRVKSQVRNATIG